MVGVGAVAPLSAVALKPASESSKPFFFSFISQHQTQNPNLSFFQLPNFTQILARQERSRFRLFALKKKNKHKGSSIELKKEADFDELENVFHDVDEDFDDVEGDDNDGDDDLMIPFERMNDWLKNKPMGFGEGKVYDTLVEDKLLEEIEQSRKSQLENLYKLKNESQEAKTKIEQLKASEVVCSDIRVRICNLPKKKNVHRDLKLAFQGVQGIIKISPVVFGNVKTRDPICKGFGFVDFKTLQDANRFVQTFSSQSVAFGKIQKQIKCEILKSDNGATKEPVLSGPRSSSQPKLAPLEVELDQNPDIEETDTNLLFGEDDVDDFDESDDEFDDEDVIDDIKLLMAQDKIPQLISTRLKVREKAELSEVLSRSEAKGAPTSKDVSRAANGIGDKIDNVDEEEVDFKFLKQDENYDNTNPKMKAELDSPSSPKKRTAKKKPVVKEKASKTPKQKIPGSARRLKGQERAKLENVFTKYGAKKALASKDM